MLAFENMCFDSAKPNNSSPASANIDIILEICVHGTLAGPIRQILKDRKLPYVSCLKKSVDAFDTMQDLACELSGLGCPVNLDAVNSPLDTTSLESVQDFPPYPWNHTSRCWNEPRTYSEHRYKRFQPHELLGSQISGSDRPNTTWRNFLRLSEVPWLSDHQIEGRSVLPGAGYIAMVIEAMRLLTDSSESSIRGYQLRDIDILNALTIPVSTSGVETQFCLRSCSEKALEYQGWYEFDVCSVSDEGSWAQNCKGCISTETIVNVQSGHDGFKASAPYSTTLFTLDAKEKVIGPDIIFVGMRKMTLEHGPVFQNSIDSRAVGDKAIKTFAIWPSATPSASDTNEAYALHPTTSDSIFQAFYVCFPGNPKKMLLRSHVQFVVCLFPGKLRGNRSTSCELLPSL